MISFNSAKTQIKQEINRSSVESVSLFNQSITNSINSWMADVYVLGEGINGDSFKPDTGVDSSHALVALSNFVSRHPDFQHLYVGMNTGVFNQRPYSVMPTGYDPTRRPWYIRAMNDPGSAIITAPYKDASTGKMVITVAKALPNGQGVVGADIALDTLTKMAAQVHVGSDGYLAILDPNRFAIIDKGITQGTMVKDTAFNPMFQAQSGTLSYTDHEVGKVISFVTNPVSGWKIIGVMLDKEYNQAAMPILDTMIWVIIGALILGVALALIITRSITRRLKILVNVSAKVARGDLTEQIMVRGQDELGRLGNSFNEMMDSLRSVIREVANSSGQVAASSEELTASAGQTSQATEHIALSMQEVALDIDSQAQSAEQSTAVVGEMSQGIRQISQSAEDVTTSALLANHVAAKGFQQLESVITEMNNIHTAVGNLAQTIKDLGEESRTINTIVHVITDIASQTNLLALNAAIEAARAGEHGRGFAVVAKEVRNLAEQSSQSAKQIANMVKLIQDRTSQAVNVTGEVSKKVGEGLRAVNIAGKSFGQIRKSVSGVADQIQEVSAAVEELLASSDEVAHAMNQISTTAQTNSSRTQNVSAAAQEQLASMEEISASAQSLAQMAEHLQQLIEQFKLA